MLQHQPVMLYEVIAALEIIPDGIYVDGTFGRGGHSAEILNLLSPKGRLICFDKDPQAIAVGKQRFEHDPRVSFYQNCFSELTDLVVSQNLVRKINGILLDLGVSAPQLEDPQRGFSFRREGPLDMRMDPTKGLSAAQWVNEAPVKEMAWVISRYGEEPFAKRIARKIEAQRKEKRITSTTELAILVADCIPSHKPGRHPATKTFQAIRIYINQELQAVDQALQDAQEILAPKGRLAVISFHSLEDQKVKQFFRAQSRVQLPPGVAIPEKEIRVPFKWVVKRQRPTAAEVEHNQRARSATLRVAEKNAF